MSLLSGLGFRGDLRIWGHKGAFLEIKKAFKNLIYKFLNAFKVLENLAECGNRNKLENKETAYPLRTC
jgi:hypothetical protein